MVEEPQKKFPNGNGDAENFLMVNYLILQFFHPAILSPCNSFILQFFHPAILSPRLELG